MHEEGSRGKGGKVVGGKVVGGENPGRTRRAAAAVNKEDRRGDKCRGLDTKILEAKIVTLRNS